jgi:hypothetical protein
MGPLAGPAKHCLGLIVNTDVPHFLGVTAVIREVRMAFHRFGRV